MNNRCPGSMAGTPTLKIKTCPECGGEVEVFSNDVKVDCENCGFTIYNDVDSCVQWCKYAKSCVGEELYKKLKRVRIGFVGLENSTRSMIAEALAKEVNTSSKLGFVSAGVAPADEVDSKTLEVLEEKNITWRGKPKDITRLGPVDLVVLMGPEIELPVKFGEQVKIIQWDFPSLNDKTIDEYRQAAKQIEDNINKLIEEADIDE